MWGFFTMNANCIKSKLTAAFSLIELMVVIAIVALLTAIAVPSYQGYLQQSKVTEIFSLASEQMNQWQQEYNLGTTFDVINPTPPALGIGQYINQAELLDATTAATVINECPTGGSGGGGLGVVCIQLVADTGIDPLLDDLVVYFTPTESGSVTGDTSNTTVGWTCNFPATGDTDDDNTIESLLNPGSCTAE